MQQRQRWLHVPSGLLEGCGGLPWRVAIQCQLSNSWILQQRSRRLSRLCGSCIHAGGKSSAFTATTAASQGAAADTVALGTAQDRHRLAGSACRWGGGKLGKAG